MIDSRRGFLLPRSISVAMHAGIGMPGHVPHVCYSGRTLAAPCRRIERPPINPPSKQPTSCFMVVSVKGGKWVRQHPAKGFEC